MLRETSDKIKKARAEQERQMKELGFCGGGRIKRSYADGAEVEEEPFYLKHMREKLQAQEYAHLPTGSKPLHKLTLGEAQKTFGTDTGLWGNWRSAKNLLDTYRQRLGSEGGTAEDRAAIAEMEKNVTRAAGFLNKVRFTGASPVDENMHKEYSKVKYLMKKYDLRAAEMYSEEQKRKHGENWITELAPGLSNAPDVEQIRKDMLGTDLAVRDVKFPFSFEKELQNLFGINWQRRLAPNLPVTAANTTALLQHIIGKTYGRGLELGDLSVPLTKATSVEEIPQMMAGGRMKKDGLTYLHGGEVVIPEKFAQGGEVESMAFDRASLNNKYSVDVNTDEIASAIESAVKEAIEASSFPKLEVETNGVSVPLDAEAATASIEAALKNASTGPGAVGAEKMDELEQHLIKMDNTLLDVKGDLERDIEIVAGKIVDRTVVNEMITVKTDPLLTEINNRASTGDEYRREIDNLKAHLSYQIEAMEAKINRVSTHIGGQ